MAAEESTDPDLARARDDPRLRRGKGAPLGDFFDAIAEAERSRRLAMWGLYQLGEPVESSAPLSTDPEARTASHRAALARAELANEYPFLNAMTLVAFYSALERWWRT